MFLSVLLFVLVLPAYGQDALAYTVMVSAPTSTSQTGMPLLDPFGRLRVPILQRSADNSQEALSIVSLDANTGVQFRDTDSVLGPRAVAGYSPRGAWLSASQFSLDSQGNLWLSANVQWPQLSTGSASTMCLTNGGIAPYAPQLAVVKIPPADTATWSTVWQGVENAEMGFDRCALIVREQNDWVQVACTAGYARGTAANDTFNDLFALVVSSSGVVVSSGFYNLAGCSCSTQTPCSGHMGLGVFPPLVETIAPQDLVVVSTVNGPLFPGVFENSGFVTLRDTITLSVAPGWSSHPLRVDNGTNSILLVLSCSSFSPQGSAVSLNGIDPIHLRPAWQVQVSSSQTEDCLPPTVGPPTSANDNSTKPRLFLTGGYVAVGVPSVGHEYAVYLFQVASRYGSLVNQLHGYANQGPIRDVWPIGGGSVALLFAQPVPSDDQVPHWQVSVDVGGVDGKVSSAWMGEIAASTVATEQPVLQIVGASLTSGSAVQPFVTGRSSHLILSPSVRHFGGEQQRAPCVLVLSASMRNATAAFTQLWGLAVPMTVCQGSTPTVSSTPSPGPSPTSTPLASVLPSSSPAATPGSNAGAIAGGVIGSLCAVVAAGVCWWKRCRTVRAPTTVGEDYMDF
jgi:hypothetical protein